MSTPHLEAQLQHDLQSIRSKVLEMMALDEKILTWSLQSVLRQDRQLAYSVILRDQAVDELEMELDRLCLEFILRHQPAAGHLRFVYSASKIIKELERIGDYAESISRQVLVLSSMPLDIPMEAFAELANQAIPMVHNAVRAFTEGNAELARSTRANEPNVRLLRDTLTTQLHAWHDQGRIPSEAISPLLTVARRFERVMEQATNICEEALYSATGQYIKHVKQESVRVLFIGGTNACVSQMAEAMAKHADFPNLTFLSAGVRSGAVDPRTIRFLEGKGIDISTHTSKRVEQVPALDQIQMAVALTKEAEQAFPLLPRRALRLTWFVPEPVAVHGDPEELEAAFEHTFQDLNHHIQDLAKAILRDDKESI